MACERHRDCRSVCAANAPFVLNLTPEPDIAEVNQIVYLLNWGKTNTPYKTPKKIQKDDVLSQ